MLRVAISASALLVATTVGAFSRTAGPGFYNATNESVQFTAKFESGRPWGAPGTLAPQMYFVDSDCDQIEEVVFMSHGASYRLSRDEILKFRGSLEPSRQIWVFDGTRVCMIRSRDFEKKKDMPCTAAP